MSVDYDNNSGSEEGSTYYSNFTHKSSLFEPRQGPAGVIHL